MPNPIPDLNRDQQCHFYQAPSGNRCGSPALKGEYYCYHHHLKHANRRNHRVLIDPEVTCMEIPVIEDRASIFVALAAVIHRLAENTIDTRRAGQMIYGLQVAMRALEPPPVRRSQSAPPAAAQPTPRHSSTANSGTSVQPATDLQPTAPTTIPISKEGLVYFLRSRHCASCNAELFPAEDLTERRNPGAPSEIVEEAHQALTDLPAILLGRVPALSDGAQSRCLPGAGHANSETLEPEPIDSTPQPEPKQQSSKEDPSSASILPTINAVASTLERHTPDLNSTFTARFALHSPRRSVSLRLVHMAPHIPASRTARPQRILNQKANRRTKWQQ
jgi:hypothetical protein